MQVVCPTPSGCAKYIFEKLLQVEYAAKDHLCRSFSIWKSLTLFLVWVIDAVSGISVLKCYWSPVLILVEDWCLVDKFVLCICEYAFKGSRLTEGSRAAAVTGVTHQRRLDEFMKMAAWFVCDGKKQKKAAFSPAISKIKWPPFEVSLVAIDGTLSRHVFMHRRPGVPAASQPGLDRAWRSA